MARRSLTKVSAAAAGVVLAWTGTALAQEPDAPDITQLAGLIRWSGLAASVVVVVAAIVVLRFVGGAASRLGTRFATRRLLIQKVESFTRFFIYFATATVVIVLSFRVNKTVLTVLGGAIAFAVGFAMRDLVAAVIAGVTIMFDRPFQVGDRVQYAGQYGDIMKIGLRSVRLRTLDDNLVTIPNNKILTDVTSSGNYGELDMQVVMDFLIGIDQDAELAERLVKEALLSSRYVYLEKPIILLVTQVLQGEYVAIRLRGKAYVLDTQYEKAFESDVHKRVLGAFREHGIRPPAILHRHEGGNGR
ncbi:MAG: mechanosensitive ion channel [Deltaproteobacteria bacterium]|jgi:small-conductance mechanosensitive channel|nr:mechanosensitive ion channel [Deltaproteobacteria bacterium]MBW2535282.1 mechanosensitive ion channel [Deltaproteobacteria bacterium]